MARASSVCLVNGCFEYAVREGRCAEHQREPFASSQWTRSKGWARRRRAVLNRAKHRCRICGRRATVVDHIVAVSFGGSDRISNLQALCVRCSAAKTTDEAHLAKAYPSASPERNAAIAELVRRWT